MYKIGYSGELIRESDGAIIGRGSGNTDYQEFLNWQAAGNEPVPYVSTLAQRKSEIRVRYAGYMAQVVQPYSQSERETWFTQLKEAYDYPGPTPLLSALAAARGITLEDIVARVKENDSNFRAAVGHLLGQQQAELDALK